VTDGQTPHADIGSAYASHRAAKIVIILFLNKAIFIKKELCYFNILC